MGSAGAMTAQQDYLPPGPGLDEESLAPLFQESGRWRPRRRRQRRRRRRRFSRGGSNTSLRATPPAAAPPWSGHGAVVSEGLDPGRDMPTEWRAFRKIARDMGEYKKGKGAVAVLSTEMARLSSEVHNRGNLAPNRRWQLRVHDDVVEPTSAKSLVIPVLPTFRDPSRLEKPPSIAPPFAGQYLNLHGDVVQAPLGAVFLDSGFDLPTVWRA